jgi:hypothetical protein
VAASSAASSWFPTFWWNLLAIIWYAIALGMLLGKRLDLIGHALSRAAPDGRQHLFD